VITWIDWITWPADAKSGHHYTIGSNTVTVSVTGQDGCILNKEYLVCLGAVTTAGLAAVLNTDA